MVRPIVLLLLLGGITGTAVSEPGAGVPAYVLQLPAQVATVLIAETNSSALHRIVNGSDGVEYVDERYMSIGQNGVGKQRAWDRRTPLGIYFITEQLDTTRLHERYGPTAFPLDYPNAWDRRNGRAGDGIWIHGVTEGGERRPPLDTDGCIALPNDELLVLEKELLPIVTPVIIAKEMRWASPESVSELRKDLNNALDAWATSILDGDLQLYLSAYADDFGYRGMSREEWARYRVETFAAAVVDAISLDQVLLLADPEEEGLYLSRFRQTIVEGGRTLTTSKRLYWRRNGAGRLQIVAEDNG
ncbi:MAG: L,D-transpeptidase family protein [Woeseiaceae bacterium]|nr:L,D-transpeptidase family protein [Woeseiaceae bacterium]